MKFLKECDDLQQLEDMDVVQKAKVKWDVEEDNMELEKPVTLEEIRAAVWDCGSQKSPGPDGFSFLFLKSYWDLLKEDAGNAVRCVFDSFVMPRGVNSSFITLIPKFPIRFILKIFVLSLIGMQYKIIAKILANRLSKVIDKVKKKLMLFKVDFEKAFDTVSWKYLDHMLLSLGFGSKWRRWIQVCLHSARSSVLVNGSPSNEFSIKRGLRQGDLLSPFLFIIVMEGLRIAMQNVVCSGLIREAVIETSGHKNSHLFYADDMVIISYWNNQDMSNIIRVLQVFDLALGLKINVSKSNVLGLGVSSQDVKDMASDTCCGPDNWNGNGPLMLRFNRLYHLDDNKDRLLSDHRVHDAWVWNWNRPIIGSRNEAALALLVSELELFF
ncbi:putative RNA-directed DNA polymerase, eukaryota, reverse transcriptase zinc-binding domain protein [Tanacetum coccineum]